VFVRVADPVDVEKARRDQRARTGWGCGFPAVRGLVAASTNQQPSRPCLPRSIRGSHADRVRENRMGAVGIQVPLNEKRATTCLGRESPSRGPICD
jgi:hypothetical protein